MDFVSITNMSQSSPLSTQNFRPQSFGSFSLWDHTQLRGPSSSNGYLGESYVVLPFWKRSMTIFFIWHKSIYYIVSAAITPNILVWQSILGESYFKCLSGRFLVTSQVCQSISGTSSSGTKVSGSVTTQNQNPKVWENPSATIHATVIH